ncbi:WD40-repeat-containing domain protein [Flagelloscypha sp. PMI_526]|nr:WD40-repeat-containing domain protein [Flagelloscypha sp. PMI_526]
MSSDGKPGLALLSLDGGSWENHGALTQIHLVEDILHKYEIDNNLEEGSARVSDVFDLIVGTGTGGLVGCMLGPLRMSTTDAKDAYLRIYASNFLSKSLPSERAETLKRALREVLDSGITNIVLATKMSSIGNLSSTCKFAVTVMMAANLSKPVMLRGYLGRNSPIQCTLLQALLATLSDAQILPPVAFGASIIEMFVATTTGWCNPTESLLEEVPSIFDGRSISAIVNIGSGRPSPVSLSGQGDFADALMDLAKSCQAVSQSIESRFSAHPGLFLRLDVDGFNHSGALQPGEIISHSRAYLVTDEVRTHLDGLIHSLKCRPQRLNINQISGLQPGILERIDKRLDSTLNTEESRILDKLNISSDAPFTSSLPASFQRQTCTPGTRIAILQRLLDWATALEPELKNSLFWLYGLAGTGKTTILRDICERFQKLNILASSYFCSIQLSSGDSRRLIPTIVRHLASRSKAFKAALLLQLEEDPDIVSATLKPQFECLLCKPWKAVSDFQSDSTTIVVAIDALDECDRGEEFLSLLLDAINAGQLDGLKFLVTSRPVPRLLAKVRTLGPDSPKVSLHELPKGEVNADIQLYLEASIALPPSRIKELVTRADGLFIYASTLVKYLSPSQPLTPIELEECAENVLAQKPERSSINPLYKQIVEVALSFDDEQVMRRRWMILHTILCAVEPPSAIVVARLLGIDSQVVTAVVESLYSVLFTVDADGPIYIFHASFHDFIVSSPNVIFPWDPPPIISSLHNHVLQKWKHHFVSTFAAWSQYLSYASRNWWAHFKRCGSKTLFTILPNVERMFLGKGILWIEVMSLLEDIRGCRVILNEMALAPPIIRTSPAVSRLARQAAKLVSLYEAVPMRITSHLYLSFLALAEEINEFIRWKDHFSPLPQVLSQKPISNRDCQLVVNTHRQVLTAALSPDGMRWVTGTISNIVHICDSQSGKLLVELAGHTSQINSVVFSPDGKSIASESNDKTVCIWDAESGKLLQKLKGHGYYVLSAIYSPNGKSIVSGSWDRTVRIWDARVGKQLQQLEGHTHCVSSAVYSPDGTTIVSGSWDETVRIWDAQSGTQLRKLKGHTDHVFAVAFSPDEKYIAAGSRYGTVHIFDSRSGRHRQRLKGHVLTVRSLAFSPDGKRIVSGSEDCTVRVWDPQSGKKLQHLEGHQNHVLSTTFSPDGRSIISGCLDGTVRTWDADLGKQFQKQFRNVQRHSGPVSCVSFSPDGGHIISTSFAGTVCIWDARSGRRLQKFKGSGGELRSSAVSPNGKSIVSGSWDKTLRIWDAKSGKQLQKLKGHTSGVNSVAFSPDGIRIVSGSWSRTICIWDAESGKLLHKLNGHTKYACSVAFSPDGKRIVSGSWDTTARIWDVGSGKQLQILKGHTDYVLSAVYSPDGKNIVSGSKDTTFCIWDAESGEQLQKLDGHTSGVNSVAFSPDGKNIVSGSWDKTVRIWDAASGKQLQKFDGHTFAVRCVAFSPDGESIVSGSEDRTIRIWDAQSSAKLGNLEGRTDFIHSIAFPADVKRTKPVGYHSFPAFSMLVPLSLNQQYLDIITFLEAKKSFTHMEESE